MPGASRIRSKSGIYHIIMRGINCQTIFEDEEDCEKFIETLKKYKEACGYVSVFLASSINATIPAHIGVAIEIPDR